MAISTNFDPNTDDPQQLKIQADTMLFVSDLGSNVTLKQKWTSLLSKIKEKLDANPPPSGQEEQSYREKLKIVDNFLAQNGYNTTASLVLSLLKTPFYQEHQKQSECNEDSDRFVQASLAQLKLMAAWQKALGNASSDRQAPDNFLKQQGYNCNAQQVAASVKKMRNVDIKFWTGIYGNSIITYDNDKTHETGPTIIVYGSTDGVSVGSDVLDKGLNKVTYQEGVLTWTQDSFTINYSGKLTFSQVTRASKDDSYVGNECFGTITYYDDSGNVTKTGSLFARIGKPPKDDSQGNGRTSCKTPPSVQLSWVGKAMKYVGYFMAGVFLVDFIASVPQRFNSIKEFAKKIKGDKKTQTEEELEKASKDVETSSNESLLENNGSFDQAIESTWSDDPNLQNEEGLNQISDEALPPAEEVSSLREATNHINKESGKTEQNPEEVEPSQEGESFPEESANPGEDITGLFEEFV